MARAFLRDCEASFEDNILTLIRKLFTTVKSFEKAAVFGGFYIVRSEPSQILASNPPELPTNQKCRREHVCLYLSVILDKNKE